MTSKKDHLPVLVDEVVRFLQPRPNWVWVDGTVGAGGHAAKVLEAIAETEAKAWLVGIDRDAEMLKFSRQKLHDFFLQGHQINLVHNSYANLADVCAQVGVKPAVLDAVLLDLGFNTLQISEGERGFSFNLPGPLDMRFDRSGHNPTAFELIRSSTEEALARLIREYGEEPFAKAIAKALKRGAEGGELQDTSSAAEIIRKSIPRARQAKGIHPATRTFQALRIAVNQELQELQKFLMEFPGLLRPQARLVIITFHSLEDRMVKQHFKALAQGCICPPNFPKCVCDHKPRVKILTRKPLSPSRHECAVNPRARSAKLRAIEML